MVTTTKPRDLDHMLQIYNRQGWYPVQWRHHPPEIRSLIRSLRFQPQLKQCYANSQRLFVGNLRKGHDLALEYHEGWVQSVIPIHHAWLTYKGEILDLTLDSTQTQYLGSKAFSVAQVIGNMCRTSAYGPVASAQDYHELSPYRAEIKTKIL